MPLDKSGRVHVLDHRVVKPDHPMKTVLAAPPQRNVPRIGMSGIKPDWAKLVHMVAVDLGEGFGEVVG